MAELAGIDDAERNRLAVSTALNVLRRHDSAVERILCSASHVIVYELERTSKKAAPRWKHTDIQGVLHVIERKGDPRFRFLVMNRKGIDNLVENLIPGEIELEFSDKLIMYKKMSGRVRSIWFYDSEEYDKARAVIESIAEGSDAYLDIVGEPYSSDPVDYKGSNLKPAPEDDITKFFPDLQISSEQPQFQEPEEPYYIEPDPKAPPPYSNPDIQPELPDIITMLQGAEAGAAAPVPFHDTAILAQSEALGDGAAQPESSREQEELVNFLAETAHKDRNKLGRGQLIKLLERMIDDRDFFEEVYSTYAGKF
ncbi:hypothetical protein NDN08_006548 [Rhodosorus marinus]|uniref:mRNA-decapping enzyme-like protein n=1 Tax=Rhodosorus marinus TaxID=101924 RepID=A0AAV8UI03_9RHOD|nr:hypothetical protein NDN08_006548 [Rhodosorus marinus]